MLYNPIKGYKNKRYPQGHISQGFGENPALYMAAIGMKSHNGIDIVAPWGTPIYSLMDGIIADVKTDPSGYGMHIRMLCEKDNKGGYEFTFGHLSKILVTVGQEVKAGTHIGNMGNTGFVVSSSNGAGFWIEGSNKYLGTHLHLSLREFKYDKRGWTYNKGLPKITILNYNNGWNGCFDFKDMFFKEDLMGDMMILKRELEKHGDEPWYMRLIRSLKFFGVK